MMVMRGQWWVRKRDLNPTTDPWKTMPHLWLVTGVRNGWVRYGSCNWTMPVADWLADYQLADPQPARLRTFFALRFGL